MCNRVFLSSDSVVPRVFSSYLFQTMLIILTQMGTCACVNCEEIDVVVDTRRTFVPTLTMPQENPLHQRRRKVITEGYTSDTQTSVGGEVLSPCTTEL